MNAVLKFRPMDPDDEPFLRQLRMQIDVDRLGLQYWDPEEQEMARKIVDLQFKAHNAHYKEVKSGWETKDNIIELNGVPVGRFIVTGGRDEIHLCDIAIERQYRNIGLGQAVLDMTKKECQESKRPLRLRVDKQNSAYQFYLKQGFRVLEDNDTHYFMEWDPSGNERKTIYSFGKKMGG